MNYEQRGIHHGSLDMKFTPTEETRMYACNVDALALTFDKYKLNRARLERSVGITLHELGFTEAMIHPHPLSGRTIIDQVLSCRSLSVLFPRQAEAKISAGSVVSTLTRTSRTSGWVKARS